MRTPSTTPCHVAHVATRRVSALQIQSDIGRMALSRKLWGIRQLSYSPPYSTLRTRKRYEAGRTHSGIQIRHKTGDAALLSDELGGRGYGRDVSFLPSWGRRMSEGMAFRGHLRTTAPAFLMSRKRSIPAPGQSPPCSTYPHQSHLMPARQALSASYVITVLDGHHTVR